jgi:hypothetical protein
MTITTFLLLYQNNITNFEILRLYSLVCECSHTKIKSQRFFSLSMRQSLSSVTNLLPFKLYRENYTMDYLLRQNYLKIDGTNLDTNLKFTVTLNDDRITNFSSGNLCYYKSLPGTETYYIYNDLELYVPTFLFTGIHLLPTFSYQQFDRPMLNITRFNNMVLQLSPPSETIRLCSAYIKKITQTYVSYFKRINITNLQAASSIIDTIKLTLRNSSTA